MKLEKLDGRFSLHEHFTHRVTFKTGEAELFVQARNWLWETFGPGVEKKLLHTLTYSKVTALLELNNLPLWVWDTDSVSVSGSGHIYMRDQILSNFILKWSV